MELSYIIQFLVIVGSVYLLYSSLDTKLSVDPGVIHLLVYVFSIGSMILLYVFYFQDHGHYWLLWSEEEIFNKILYLNTLYVVSFSIVYTLLVRLFGDKVNAPSVYARNFQQYKLIHFVIVYLIALAVGVVLKVTGQDYLNVYWGNVIDLAYLILFALLFAKIKSVRMMILAGFLVMAYMMLIHVPLIQSEEYVVNRGGVIKIFVFSFVFIHVVGRAEIFTLKRLLMALAVLPVILGATQFVEAYVGGAPVEWIDLLIYVGSGYELRMMENQAVLLDLLERNVISQQMGDSYLFAILDLIAPTLNQQMSPSQWFTEYVNYNTDVTSAYAFSFIAEGVLNFGEYGAVVAGVLGAIILYLVRFTLQMNWSFAPFVYAYLVVLSYFVYRADLTYVSKKIQFAFFSAIILFLILKSVRALLLSSNRPNKIHLSMKQ